MNKWIWIGISAAVLSLALSIGIIIHLCQSGECYGIRNINFGDTAVTVLCAIVGLLVGWNIFTALDLKKEWKDLERRTIKEISQLKEEKIRLREYIKANRNYAIGITNYMNGMYGNAIGSFCSVAVKANKISDEETLNDCLNLMEKAIDNHKNNMGNVAYLKAVFQLVKDDFKRIEDERIANISKTIEDIISSQNE